MNNEFQSHSGTGIIEKQCAGYHIFMTRVFSNVGTIGKYRESQSDTDFILRLAKQHVSHSRKMKLMYGGFFNTGCFRRFCTGNSSNNKRIWISNMQI